VVEVRKILFEACQPPLSGVKLLAKVIDLGLRAVDVVFDPAERLAFPFQLPRL